MSGKLWFKPIAGPRISQDCEKYVGTSLYGMITPPRLGKTKNRGWNEGFQSDKLKNNLSPRVRVFVEVKPRSKSVNSNSPESPKRRVQQDMENTLNEKDRLDNSFETSQSKGNVLFGLNNHYAGAKFSEPPPPAKLPQPPTQWMQKRTDKLYSSRQIKALFFVASKLRRILY
ncbi:proline-rich nuclear receptor coactivator 2-like [Limulus polyphemus]|uniref:Proline-rich nuclear receptor coactivator 2-like n=1 Tax=Limulus polyphemus TaxID=6850 RepID=A0ABM1BKF5_LIMPO|nr:proline-rich nuclear receptor coactivator 2-like [Limulus polyphemus]